MSLERRSVVLLVALCGAACPQAGGPRRDGTSAPAGRRPEAKTKRPAPNIPDDGPLAQKILYEQAKGLLRAGKPGPAVDVFRRSIAAHGNGELVASCHLGLGSALGDLGQHEEAVEAYKKVVELRPDDAEAYRALAAGEEDAGKMREARESLEHSLALDPNQPSAYQDLASLCLRAKDVEGAKRVYLRYELTRTRLVLTLAKAKDDGERASAARVLGEARDEATAKALGLALTDRSPKVRLAVIRALGQQALSAGAGPLRELLERTQNPEEKRQIELSLAAIAAAAQPATPPAVTPAPAPPPGATQRERSRRGP
jgi:tetratricopeptide (TPR) repeat protein